MHIKYLSLSPGYAMMRILIFCGLLALISCQRSTDLPSHQTDVLLIGAGIMSATLGSMVRELDPKLKLEIYERLEEVALESSSAWNNAGTGHASYAELNYTPELSDGSIDIKKALEIGEAFEISKQYWAYLAKAKKLHPKSFIKSVPHMSFVWGDDDVAYLKKRYQTMSKHPFYAAMQYSEDPAQIKSWAPLLMAGREPSQKLAATRMVGGVDVDFGALTKALINSLLAAPHTALFLSHEAIDIKKAPDGWDVIVRDRKSGQSQAVRAKFVFIGAGGQALPLLQKTGIPESKGFGGFPVGGAWLVTDRPELIEQHNAKVYGKASVGSPPMSVPHLDSRFIDGKESLLFGPFATYSTKFLKEGSWLDLPASVKFDNLIPMLEAGFKNIDLVGYLLGQVLMTKEQRLDSLKAYFPEARLEDWSIKIAGQRVQVIKNDPKKGGVLQFGTELVSSADGSIVALLGASPGASVAVKAMITILEKSFKAKVEEGWSHKLKEMIPSYGSSLINEPGLWESVKKRDQEWLGLEP